MIKKAFCDWLISILPVRSLHPTIEPSLLIDPDSFNGERLVLRTEYYGGAPVMASKMIARRKTTEEEIAPQSQILYGKLSCTSSLATRSSQLAHADGTISTLVAVKPARFKRLQLASEQLVRNAQHIAGLNPRAFR